MSVCASCGARIIWVTMIDTRKRMPLDFEPVDTGTVVVDWRHHAGAIAERGDPGPRFQSHFVTCPDATDWRRS